MGVHLFDDGADESPLSRLAADYLTLLSPLDGSGDDVQPGARGPYLRTLRQLPVDPSEETILGQTAVDSFGPLPGAYVVVGGARAISTQPGQILWEQTVRVYLVSGSPGSLVKGRLRDSAKKPGQDPGTFTMCAHAIEYLHGAALDTVTAAGAVQVTDHAPVYSSPKLSIWVVVTEVKMAQVIRPSRDKPPIDSVGANHNPDRAGTIARQRRDF